MAKVSDVGGKFWGNSPPFASAYLALRVALRHTRSGVAVAEFYGANGHAGRDRWDITAFQKVCSSTDLATYTDVNPLKERGGMQ